jgi:hypothetical protein
MTKRRGNLMPVEESVRSLPLLKIRGNIPPLFYKGNSQMPSKYI